MERKKSSTNISLYIRILNKQPQKNNDYPTAQTATAAIVAIKKWALTIEFGIRSSKMPQYSIYKCRRTQNNSVSFKFTSFNFHHWFNMYTCAEPMYLWISLHSNTAFQSKLTIHEHVRIAHMHLNRNAHTHDTFHFLYQIGTVKSEQSIYIWTLEIN